MPTLPGETRRSGRFRFSGFSGASPSRPARPRRTPSGAFAFHLFGTLALLVSLFLPLTDLGAALASPATAAERAMARAQASDDETAPAPTDVVLIGDFQTALGCPTDFDPTCQVTVLTEDSGLWSGTFPVPTGDYEYQIVATGVDGQQRLYGEGGIDGDPLTLDVGDVDTGAYFSFNPRTGEIRAEPVGALYTLATVDDEILLVPEEDELSAVVNAPGGDFPYQVVINGEPVGEQQSVPLDPGLNRLTFDLDGNLLDTEPLPGGTLTVTRDDGATGACYQLRDGDDVVNQACDVDDGEDGVTVMTFPQGLEPGDYTVVETVTPEGVEQAADADVELAPGENFVEVQAAPGDDDGDEGDETPAIDATDGGDDDETPQVTADVGGQPGDLIVTLQTEDQQPVGGACFQLLDDDDTVVAESCDTAEAGDGFPDNGNTGFFGVPSGDYTLRMSETPEGIETVDDREVTVEANTEVTETITATTVEAEETPEPTATTPAAEQTGDLVVLRIDETGAAVGGACFEIVDDTGAEVASEVCDEDGDLPDDGRIGFFDVPVGTWTLRETRTPDEVEPAGDQPVEIFADAVYDLPVQTARIATETPSPTDDDLDETPEPTATTEPQPGSLIVTLQDEAQQPVGGACFELVDEDGQVAAESCDSDDPFPGNGNTGFFGVPSGTYTLRISQTPDNVEAPDDREVEVPAGGEATEVVPVAVTEETTETETETETDTATADGDTGTVEVTFATAVEQEPVCVELNTSGGIGLTDPPAACDNGEGDVSDDPGVIQIEDVPAGDYTLTVTEGPEALTELEGEPVTVEAGGATQVGIDVEPAPPPTQTPTPSGPESGTLTITVQDPDGQPLGDACFDVTNESGTLNFCEEDDDGTLVIEDVLFGEQTIAQTEAAEGFELAPNQTVTITQDDPEAEVTFTNQRGAGILPVVAVDAEGGELPGACWVLAGDEDEFGPLCDDGSNGGEPGDGQVTFEQIPPGDYTLREETPPEGYQPVDETPITVQSGENEPLRVEHEPAPATVRITTTGSDGATLAGACYTLDGGDEICDVDADGILNIEGVAPGEHILDQTVPPDGYREVEDQTVTVEIGQSLVEVGVINEAATGTVAVNVTNADGEALNGACAAVDGGEPVCDGAPNDAFGDEIGRIGIADVAVGDHEVALTTVAEDFQLPTEAEPVPVEADATAEVDFTLAAVEPATGTLEMSIRDAEGAAVPGTCIVLTNAGEGVELGPFCDNGEGDTSDDEGLIRVEEVQVGTYTASLTEDSRAQIPDFQSASTRTVRIEADQTTTAQLVVVIVEEATTGVVEVVTRDVDSGELLPGACYELRGNGDPVVLCDDDGNDENGTDGIIRRLPVEQGTYTLVQTTTPDTYETMPDREDVQVNAAATTRIEVDLQKEEQPGTLVVEKVDPNGELLPGACFEVRQSGAAVDSVCDATDDSPNDGIVAFDLTAGTYRLVETRAPSSEFRPGDNRTVTINAGEETRVEVVNRLRPGRVEIFTVDSADPDERLEGACYELRGDTTYGPFCDDDDLNVDGRVVFERVAPGDYTVVETVPPPGFEAAGERAITVSPGGLTQITVENAATPPPPERGRLIVYKQDGQREELPGGCFRLFDGDRSVTAEVCDNDDGANDATIDFENVPAGTWMLHETLAPSPSYQIGDPVEVTIEDDETTEVSVVNELKRGRILVRKTNPQGHLLQGACFDLGQDEGGERCTDASGRVSFDGLPPGTYDLTETRAPFGYQPVSPREVRVEPGQTTVLDLVDQIVPPDPDTGSIQVQTFTCPAGDEGERTLFLGGAEGNAELKNTAGCRKGNAEFTLEAQGGGGPGSFVTGDDGQYQVTLPAGVYTLTETAPDLPGDSSAEVRVSANELTTVIVINFIAPPEPEPATIEVVMYTCPDGFDGTLYDDFAQSCAADDRLTNNVTVRANGPENASGVTGDGGVRGRTTLSDLPTGFYSVFEERPYTIPTSYGFCGFDADYPADFKTVNAAIEVNLEAGATLTCAFFNIPEELTETTGTILVRKYACDVNDPPSDYDWYEECRLSDEGASFELNTYVIEGDRYEPYTTGTANPDGLLRFPRLQPGTYQLKEIGSNWCHAESNSVNSKGDVVVRANQLSEVWIFNCIDTKSPPNTGAGPNAGLPDGGDATAVLLGLAWPLAALAAWQWRRNRWADAA